jgi:myo-inositol-1(or 4)-monophosphatase
MNAMDLQKIEKAVIDVCQEVGQFMKKESEAFDLTRIEKKGGDFNNLVSYVDKEAERKLVTALRKIHSTAGFITEEGTVVQASQEEFSWIIDPLDGTTNFLHGLPLYAISIALAQNNVPIVGVIHHVVPNDCYHAVRGQGAFCNEKKIHVSAVAEMREGLLATGFPYYHQNKSDVYLEIIKNFLTKTHGIRRLGSAALDLALVASGKLEGFFEYNLNPWDVAAGILIVQEAGGKVTDFQGGNNFLFGGELCVSNNVIHNQMLDVIKPQWGY